MQDRVAEFEVDMEIDLAAPRNVPECPGRAQVPERAVSMDMITVDLTPVPKAAMGSEVTLWGYSTSGAVLPIDEVARTAGTVGYELMCALAQRVPVVVA